jgi:hypothetical protein
MEPRGRGRRGFRRATEERRISPEERQLIAAWFAGRLTPGTLEGADPSRPVELAIDSEEILVTVHLPAVDLGESQTAVSDEARFTAEVARIDGFRATTRERRIAIAEAASSTFSRQVSWAAACGSTRTTFTSVSVPVMTRCRMPERLTLDTLVDAGVARSRSDALAWCVRLFAEHEQQWLSDLRTAFAEVEAVRSRGPGAPSGPGAPAEPAS